MNGATLILFAKFSRGYVCSRHQSTLKLGAVDRSNICCHAQGYFNFSNFSFYALVLLLVVSHLLSTQERETLEPLPEIYIQSAPNNSKETYTGSSCLMEFHYCEFYYCVFSKSSINLPYANFWLFPSMSAIFLANLATLRSLLNKQLA